MPVVLLAEDEFLIRALLVDALAGAGLECLEASTGKAALDFITGDTQIDAIIVDIGLPDMSGEKVIEAALGQRPGIPIVRCSGIDGEIEPPAGIHVFSKPYSAIQLSKFVASLISGEATPLADDVDARRQ
jgi:CheY-like chemotaxis protein